MKLEGWNIQNKEAFVRYLIMETACNFENMIVDQGRASREQYWDYVEDLKELTREFIGVEHDADA